MGSGGTCAGRGRKRGSGSGRPQRGLLIAVWLGVLSLALAAGWVTGARPALAASPLVGAENSLVWANPVPIDDEPPYGAKIEVGGVSCPSTVLCVAVDYEGDVIVSTHPTGGTSAWVRAKVSEYFRAVSCPSTELCVAVGPGVIATSTDPTGGVGAWQTVSVKGPLRAVSCATASMCVVVDDSGDVWSTGDPTGGANAWSRVQVEEEALGGVSCPTIKLCVAVGSEYGDDVITSTDPLGGAAAWTVTKIESGNSLLAVSCASESLCVVTAEGTVLTATDPTGGAGSWTSTHVGGGSLQHLTCASWGLCIALNGSDAITSTDPTGGAAAWASTSVEPGGSSLKGASCPAASLCVLVDSGSAVFTSSDPTGGAGAWTVTPVEVGHNELADVSCASVQLCVWVDFTGNVVTSTDPAGGAGAWVEAHVDGHSLDGVSCPSVGFCVAVDNAGDVLTSTDPTGGVGAWRVVDVDGAIPLERVSCAGMSVCVAIDREGNVVASADPTGGVGAWGVTSLGGGRLGGVACPSVHLCVVTDVTAGHLVTSSDPAGGVGAWSESMAGAGRKGEISCVSVSLCVAVAEGGEAVVGWGNPTSGGWTGASFELNGLGFLSCATGGACLATSYAGNGSPGNVIYTSEPAAGAGGWFESNLYGVPIVPPSDEFSLFSVDMAGVACMPGGMCVVGDLPGRVIVGAPPTAPADTVLPVVLGTPAVGSTLACGQGSWAGYPLPTFGVQWLLDGALIAGATAGTYVVGAADAGGEVACEVTASNAYGQQGARSNPVQVPAPVITPGGGGSGTGTGASGGGTSGGSGGAVSSSGGDAGQAAPGVPGGGSGQVAAAGPVGNAFLLSGVRGTRSHGTVELTLTLPGPGTVQVVGETGSARPAAHGKRPLRLVVTRAHVTARGAGRVTIMLAPTAAARAILARDGELQAAVRITYTPSGGTPRSITRTVMFAFARSR